MSKTRRWVIILLSLAILVLIGINLADKDDPAAVMVNSNDPTYKKRAYGYRRVQSGRRVELSSDRAAR